MNFKSIVKKYAKYALCAAALSGGVIASSALSNNKVSALESTDKVLVMSGTSTTLGYETFIGDIFSTKQYSWIESADDLNTICLMLNQIPFDSSFTYYQDAIIFANIDDIDNFNFDDHAWVMTHSGTATSNSVENAMVLIRSSGNIFERMKEEGFSEKLENTLLKCLYGIMVDKTNENISLFEESSNVFLYGLIGSKANDDGTYTPLGEQFIEFADELGGERKVGCLDQISDWSLSVNASVKTYDELINGSSSGGSSTGGYTEEDLNNSYNQGVEDGKNGVDITIDNQDYADQYIQDNNYHSDEEYLAYGEEQRQIGIDSVDTSIDNQEAINNYIDENNLKTEIQYKEYGKKQFEAGAESVDVTSNDKEVYEKGFSDGAESIDVTIDNEEIYDDAYNKGYKDNKFWKQVGRLFGNIGSLFVNAWTGVKGWFR